MFRLLLVHFWFTRQVGLGRVRAARSFCRGRRWSPVQIRSPRAHSRLGDTLEPSARTHTTLVSTQLAGQHPVTGRLIVIEKGRSSAPSTSPARPRPNQEYAAMMGGGRHEREGGPVRNQATRPTRRFLILIAEARVPRRRSNARRLSCSGSSGTLSPTSSAARRPRPS